MLALIFTVLFSLVVAYFATQNTSYLILHFGYYTWAGIPIYVVVLGSLLVGLLFAWLFHLLSSISSSIRLNKKEHALKDSKDINLELRKKVHQLELENAKLTVKEKNKDQTDDNSL
jgi:uncharacterized integral membrane protein